MYFFFFPPSSLPTSPPSTHLYCVSLTCQEVLTLMDIANMGRREKKLRHHTKECKILPVVMATEHITIGIDFVERLP